MKFIILVPDGMADRPLAELGGKTPLAVAKTPAMDFLAQGGVVGQVQTIPSGFSPASDVANLAILGYDPQTYYCGRAPLEAANLGITLAENDVAFRCNLITVEGETLIDYSAGHISSEEAKALLEFLDKRLGSEGLEFFPGVSYRHLTVFRNEKAPELLEVQCTPPHDITGQSFRRHLPQGKAASRLIKLMENSHPLLTSHEINQVRIDLKENPANMIWLWGQGKKPQMPTFKELFGLKGAIVSAVDLIKGIGRIIGLQVLEVAGATGYYDTNYEGKAEAALEALKKNDFVFIHVEATDEAGHNGDIRAKIACIERFDKLIAARILEGARKFGDFRILLLSDHATPIAVRTHTSEPVGFLLYGTGMQPSGVSGFDEEGARSSSLFFEKADKLVSFFLKQ